MAYSKVKDKNFKVIKNETGNTPQARLVKLVLIVVTLLVVVGISAFLLFSPKGRAPGVQGDTPDAMIRGYSTYVRPLAPPSTTSPTQLHVREWLEYFDRPSRQWFHDNAAKLSFQGARRDAETWKGWNRDRREIEAMKYVLSQSPFRGGVVNNMRTDDANNRAVIELKSLDQTHTLPLVKESGGWRFAQMMGQQERLDQTLAAVNLP
jgi:hypothetical protein